MTCDWPVDRTCLPDLPPEDDPSYAVAVATRNGAEDVAVAIMWALSGRQFGVCPQVVRPCSTGPWPCADVPPGYGGTLVLAWDGSDWFNTLCGCSGSCVAQGPNVVHLPGPAVAVTEVNIGSQTLDPTGYVLENDVLYRVGGDWPRQDMSHPLPQEGTWSVEYLRGRAVPPGVDRLTGLLAGEFVSACSGGKCRLPRQVTNVTRNGVTYQVYDPNDMYATGKTGLAECDLWLSAINPNALAQPPSVVW